MDELPPNDHKSPPTAEANPDDKTGNIPLPIDPDPRSHPAIRIETKTHKRNSIGKTLFRILEALGIIAVIVYTFLTYSIRQASIKSADAAKQSSDIADATLKEIKSGGSDTHELAVQAKNQADRMKDMAERALSQAKATNALAGEAKRSADIAKQSLDENIRAFRLDQRPWVVVIRVALSEEPQENKGFTVTLFTSNTGKTPAINVIPHL